MMIRRSLAAISLLVAGATLALTHCRTPSAVVGSPSQKVLLISYDGTGADDLEALRSANKLGSGGFNRIRREGVFARSIPVNPSLTSPAHISIATGATPQQTGIVSNTFHLPGTPRTQAAHGFDAPFDTETLWESVRRQGKRVGVVTFPGGDGKGPRRTADWGLTYAHPVAPSRILELIRGDFIPETPSPAILPSFSPVRRAVMRWEVEAGGRNIQRDITLLVFDTTDDEVENYDEFRLRDGEKNIEPDPRRWFPISAPVKDPDGPALYGSWSKLLELHPRLDSVLVYWGPICRNRGYPSAYQQMIDREVGFWPGPPDEEGFAEDWLEKRTGVDPGTFGEQLSRISEFLTRATVLSMQRMPWDLILSYQPVVDEAQHTYRLVNDRQQWSTQENREAGRGVRELAYRLVDRATEQLITASGSDVAVLVTGDHGLAAIDTSVRVNRLLVNWGLASTSERWLAEDTRWAAFTSGYLAHIYAFEPRAGEREDLVRRLETLRAPDGDLVFERVFTKQPGDHPNSGDVMAYAHLRFYPISGVEGDLFAKTRHFGHHGGLNHHHELHTIFGAIGRAVRPVPPQLEQTEIAAYVSLLLGIEPPRQAQPWLH
jgi:predicted AlkP superfamily phosphohydrolase/phosphomutase